MTNTQKWTASIAAIVVIGGGLTFMALRHDDAPQQTASKHAAVLDAPAISDNDITQALQRANVSVQGLMAHNVGGIVVLRGTADAPTAERATAVVKSLGITRVANLIQTPAPFDDENIRREAERQLAGTRALDGCTLKVSCNQGILRVSGTIQNDLQEDAAKSVLRSVHGAHEVQVQLSRL